MTYRGGCHCGEVAFEVDGDLPEAEILECNCSICSRKAYLRWIVAPSAFHLLTPTAAMATYTFNTATARHYFCRQCGVASFYVPRSDPGKIDVNVRCLEGVDLSQLTIKHFDGHNWERAMAKHASNVARNRNTAP